MAWWQTRWAKAALVALIGAAGVYGLVYRDVVSRAKESYLEAEKYMAWHQNPADKKNFFDRQFQSDKAKLDERLAKKSVTDADYKERVESLEFDRDYALGESSLKYAYQWYKDTYELFSPPESKWVKMAREKAPQALALWKQELGEQKIPFEDATFD